MNASDTNIKQLRGDVRMLSMDGAHAAEGGDRDDGDGRGDGDDHHHAVHEGRGAYLTYLA